MAKEYRARSELSTALLDDSAEPTGVVGLALVTIVEHIKGDYKLADAP